MPNDVSTAHRRRSYNDKFVRRGPSAFPSAVRYVNDDYAIPDTTLPQGNRLTDQVCRIEKISTVFSLPAPEPDATPRSPDTFLASELVECDDGIYFVKNIKGKEVRRRIASKFNGVAHARSSSSSDRGACLEFVDADRVTHEVFVPYRSLVSGSVFAAKLASRGAFVSSNATDVNRLREFVLTHDPGVRATIVSKPGWEGSQFIFPDASREGSSCERIIYPAADPACSAFTQSGQPAEWKSNVATLCQDNSRLVLAIAVALTGPVLPLLGGENGGFHFSGTGSTGKSTTLSVASSVWGPPERFISTWWGTVNGIATNALQRNHTLMVLDEMGQSTPKDAGNVVYTLGNGQDKLRANQAGNPHAKRSWQLMILSAGEVSLQQHLASGGIQVMAGQEIRMIDIQADARAGHGVFENIHGCANSAEFSDRLKQKASNCYGEPGRLWIRALADPTHRPELLQQIQAHIDGFEGQLPNNADGLLRRGARRFGMATGVAEACIRLGILPWPQGHAAEQIGKCFNQWRTTRGGGEALGMNQTMNRLSSFLSKHAASKFPLLVTKGIVPPTNCRKPRNPYGYQSVSSDGTDFFITSDVFTEKIFAGMNPRHCTKQLVDAGVLIPDKHGVNQIVKYIPKSGATRFYHVHLATPAQPQRDALTAPKGNDV